MSDESKLKWACGINGPCCTAALSRSSCACATSTPTAGVTPNHDNKGRAAKGNNLRGEVKAKRTRGLARFLAQETRDGQEMGEVMLRIAREDGHRDQLKAAEAILIRIMGKPADSIEVTGKGGEPLNPLAKVSIEDLLALARAKTEGA